MDFDDRRRLVPIPQLDQIEPTTVECILEVLTIPAFDEMPWLFDMERGQKLSVSVIASHEIDVVVCAEHDYDEWVESGMETDRPEYGFLESSRSIQHVLHFRSPSNGLIVVLIVNPGSTDVEVAISLQEHSRRPLRTTEA
jgi:hypothetical protein